MPSAPALGDNRNALTASLFLPGFWAVDRPPRHGRASSAISTRGSNTTMARISVHGLPQRKKPPLRALAHPGLALSGFKQSNP